MEIKQLLDTFVDLYGGSYDDLRIFAAPGRVNLIGEHTDYNGGYVFPAALDMKTVIIGRKRDDNIIRLKATDLDIIVEADTKKLDSYKGIKWGDYQLGVAYIMQKEGYDITGADLLYDDGVPHGGGLSSSAAIEVSTALMFATFSNEKRGIKEDIDMIKMALLSQKAEHEYAGVKCGIMDQFASSMGKKDHAILLNCSNLDYRHVPLELGDVMIIIANTNKKHSLGSSKYNERRLECEKAFDILGKSMKQKTCLCDITPEEFEESAHLIEDETVRKRAQHVIYENDRAKRGAELLESGDIEGFGRLMNESHASLRDKYEVSCFELDTMVCEAQKLDFVLGSRMTGGGFGGCTVSLVKQSGVDEFIRRVGKAYEQKTGIKPTFYTTKAADGAKEIVL